MLSTQKSGTQESAEPIARQAFPFTVSRISPLWIIVLVWAASNLLLLALQGMGFGIGFNVHPLGEDRKMIRLMTNYPGLELHGQFWSNGKPEPSRTMVVSSVFATDIPPARRTLPFAKAR